MSVAEILRKPETLRKMLDERGVEHYDRFDVTEWVGSDGEICHTSVTYSNGATVLVLRKCTTPAQAIAATLSAGTCHMVQTCHVKVAGVDYYDDDYECSECGAEMFEGFNFCPHCGARVVEVDE